MERGCFLWLITKYEQRFKKKKSENSKSFTFDTALPSFVTAQDFL